ncbi:MAG: HD domain-containing protein [Acidimicrobiales bacterium]
MATNAHLARRFFGSLRPGGPSAPDAQFVQSVLSSEEHALWQRMSGPDRRHSAQVARAVQHTLGDAAPTEVLAAALLHDVGKIHSRLRTFGRVVATLTIKTAGRDEVASWVHVGGLHRRIALYQNHPDIGGDDLELAGSHPLTTAWTREHHRNAEEWSIPHEYATVLDACDND